MYPPWLYSNVLKLPLVSYASVLISSSHTETALKTQNEFYLQGYAII